MSVHIDAGNVHSVVRGGTCRWSQGPTDCALYYTKLSGAGAVMIPTTMLQLEGNGGLHKQPELVVSPRSEAASNVAGSEMCMTSQGIFSPAQLYITKLASDQ